MHTQSSTKQVLQELVIELMSRLPSTQPSQVSGEAVELVKQFRRGALVVLIALNLRSEMLQGETYFIPIVSLIHRKVLGLDILTAACDTE